MLKRRDSTKKRLKQTARALRAVFAFYLFVFPAYKILQARFDPLLLSNQPIEATWAWHKSLSQRFDQWAAKRIATKSGTDLDLNDISGTEWPAYGAVFYLRSTEFLEASAINQGRTLPSQYAATAIENAADLIADPANASWVKRHWGERYLQRENVFYRMLLIDGLSSYQILTASPRFETLIRAQATLLANELDASEFGLLDDYPGQCYPTDIIAAWRAIQKADQLMELGLGPQIQRGLRAFIAPLDDPTLQLPPFTIDKLTGLDKGPVRGSYTRGMLFLSAYLWPEQSRLWFDQFETRFHERGFLLDGYREVVPDERFAAPMFFFDIDAGPVLFDLGTAASAFAVGSARAHGRFDVAAPIALEMIAASWPLPNGSMLLARAVSDASDAPFIGEAAILANLAQPAAPAFSESSHISEFRTPGFVWMMFGFYLSVAYLLLRSEIKWFRTLFTQSNQ